NAREATRLLAVEVQQAKLSLAVFAGQVGDLRAVLRPDRGRLVLGAIRQVDLVFPVRIDEAKIKAGPPPGEEKNLLAVRGPRRVGTALDDASLVPAAQIDDVNIEGH